MEKTKLRKDLEVEIEIPEGITVELEDKKVKVSNGKDTNERNFNYNFKMEKIGNKIKLSAKKSTKKEKKTLMSTRAHIQNMIRGLKEKYVYKLQVCAVHFPITTVIDKGEFIIKNFLGEVKPRKFKLKPGVEVKIEKEIITVQSHNKELAGQTAADMEIASKIRNRDRRVFQDGIFITKKPEEDRK